ncbi:hypothetical protein SDC9_103834 [bioreactor metagenome]|uniref:Uncharacterized protein n=1 Tax=bioreactor metagenome TaxID=1076179 RepID=A0A645AV69_9ZZZZ
MDGDEQPVRMKDRQGVDQHVAALLARAPAPVLLEHESVREQIAMREHRSLAAPRGAAGVENGSQIVGLARHRRMLLVEAQRLLQQAAVLRFAQRKDMLRAAGRGHLCHPVRIAGRAHHHGGLGIADEIFDLGALVGGIERQEHMARPQCGQVQHQRLDRLFHLHRNTAADGQTERSQPIRHARTHAV